MAKVLSRLDILLHANTANYVREMKKATDKTKKELKSVADYGKLVGGQLGVAFATLGSTVSVSHIIATADQMQNLASQIRLATSSTEQFHAVQTELRAIANEQRSSFDAVVDLYSNSQRSLSALGKSQQDVINFTRNMTMAMNVGGRSAQAQAAALTQLGQALASGALRGDEFNSVAEQAPILMDLIAKEMGVTSNAIRELAKDGKITADVVYNAVAKATDSLSAMSAKMPTTVSQAMQVIKNEYGYLVDDIMNQNSMMSQNLANAVLWAAEHFRTLVSAGAMVGAVWLANVARNSALVTSFVGLTSATLANTNSAYNYVTQLADKATQATKANASLADSYNSVGSAATNAANATKNASDKTKKATDDIGDAINELDALVAKLHHESHQLLNNSLSEMIFETDNKLGKFYGATEAQKQKLKDLAGQKDLYTATKKANDELKSLARTIKLVGKQTPFDELRNDLFDVRHEMSVLNGETKNNLLLWAANAENAKLAFELNQRSSQINHDAMLSNHASSYQRELLDIERQINEELQKYAGLKQDGTEHIYEQIKANLQLHAIEQKKLATHRAYMQLVFDSRSEEEKRLDILDEQLTILAEQHRLHGTDVSAQSRQLMSELLDLPKPDSSAFDELNFEYENRLNRLGQFMDKQKQLYKDNEYALTQIAQEGVAARIAIDEAYQDAKRSSCPSKTFWTNTKASNHFCGQIRMDKPKNMSVKIMKSVRKKATFGRLV